MKSSNLKLSINELQQGMLGEHAQIFLCHAVRSILAEKNQVDNWSHLRLELCERKMFDQLSAACPKFFKLDVGNPSWDAFSMATLTGTILDDWLDWEVIEQYPTLAEMWGKNQQHMIVSNYHFRCELLRLMIEDNNCGEFVLNME